MGNWSRAGGSENRRSGSNARSNRGKSWNTVSIRDGPERGRIERTWRSGQQDNWKRRSSQISNSISRTENQPLRRDRYSADSHDHNRRNVQSNQGPKSSRTMGFRFVQKLTENDDIQQVILDLSNDRNGFETLLQSIDMSNDLVVLLAKLLRNICDASFHENKITLLSGALQSRFMEKLTAFVTNIIHQNEQDRKLNRHFWDDPNEFWHCLIKLSKTVQELIPTKCEPIKKLLKNMSIFIPMIEKEHSVDISETIKSQTNSLLEVVDNTIKNLEVKEQRALQSIPVKEPPNDFRSIEIIPSVEEVVSNLSPFLRENIIDRPFRDVEQYLDIQFRLLREDFVAPLRRGISTFLKNRGKPKSEWEKLHDIKIYNPIRFLCAETLNDCNCYKIKFDFNEKKKVFRYENSKRFMFGSLVCFTRDNFKSLLFGKIVKRDEDLLKQGMLIVGFQNEAEVSFEHDYLMVESSVYFEPYYHVLGVLKRMDPHTFPMERYIIRVETDSRHPQYLLQSEDITYKVQGTTFSPKNIPSKRFYSFNDSQLAAFKAALSDEFSIIQGPPGTGKTYLGLKIARVLLQNRHVWYKHTPILVICYTNHALDQFLEGILPTTDSILRIGGQSKNEKLKDFNLSVRRRNAVHQAPAIHQKKRIVQEYIQELETISDTLNRIEANESVIGFSCLKTVIENYEQTWFAHATSDEIRKWLLEGKSRNQQVFAGRNDHRSVEAGMQHLTVANANADSERPEDLDEDDQRNTEYLDDDFNDIKICRCWELLSVKEMRHKLQVLNLELEELLQQPKVLDNVLREEYIDLEIWETETDLAYLLFQLNFHADYRNRTRPGYINLQQPYRMRYAERWQLYYYWIDEYIHNLRQTYAETSAKFREVFRAYNEMREMTDAQLMKNNLVVGLTTTGAARLQASLQALKSPIVIVEEAAEVLEAHIVASLTNHCQHLILIGDHLQLKPGAADYKIVTKYKLGISLFERMVRNKIKCHTLNIQHRMKPEISSLIKPHIYLDLQDHESTLRRPPILGVEKSLYFIDHRVEEEGCEDASKKNIHESTFLIAFARHLILNGYEPNQITILVAYLGQYFEMVREKKKPNNKMLLQDVRISVLDNYQGEESDIILLSLVRSNPENKAGFLKIQNRVCVALSRARNGLFIIGNMSLLLKANSENQVARSLKSSPVFVTDQFITLIRIAKKK